MNIRSDYIPDVRLADYEYLLPEEQIAFRPSDRRDGSRLLVCDAREGSISHYRFLDLPSLLPPGAVIVVNDTRVVRARLHLHKESGGRVEILLVDPVGPSSDPALALTAKGECLWRCMVGGLKKIRNGGEVATEFLLTDGTKGTTAEDQKGELRAAVEKVTDDGILVRFRWTPPHLSFAEVLELAGHIPLPPYIKREDAPDDVVGYQTVYARHEGAVAAPTAGLHFTEQILKEIEAKGIETVQVTLHVGAGTFAPVKGKRAAEHAMHAERISITRQALARLREGAVRREGEGTPLIVVGTTSLRTLESLYWFGVKLMRNEISPSSSELTVNQWDPYRLEQKEENLPSLSEALQQVEQWESRHNLGCVSGVTRLMILPGYRFRTCDALVTNFHQPGSTLILLVAAYLGNDLWRRAYEEALSRGYRFLSYGDSSLLIGPNSRLNSPPVM